MWSAKALFVNYKTVHSRDREGTHLAFPQTQKLKNSRLLRKRKKEVHCTVAASTQQHLVTALASVTHHYGEGIRREEKKK